MHELALVESLVSTVGERVGASRVKSVSLEVGELTAVMPDALRFCFDICAQGTALEGASLEIVPIPGVGRCRVCGQDRNLADTIVACPCGSFDMQILSGSELRIREVEVT